MMFRWRPVSLKARSLLRVVMMVDPFRLWGRYTRDIRISSLQDREHTTHGMDGRTKTVINTYPILSLYMN